MFAASKKNFDIEVNAEIVDLAMKFVHPYAVKIDGVVGDRWRVFERKYKTLREQAGAAKASEDNEEESEDDEEDEEEVAEETDAAKDDDVQMLEASEVGEVAGRSLRSRTLSKAVEGDEEEPVKDKKSGKARATKYLEYDAKKHTIWAKPVSNKFLLFFLTSNWIRSVFAALTIPKRVSGLRTWRMVRSACR